jgi:hypothetical protein
MKKSSLVAFAFGAALLAGPALAETIPDMRGTWVGTSESIVTGTSGHHAAGGAKEAPLLDNIPFTIVVTRQDGHRFWGTVASPRKKEVIVGVVGLDGKSVVARTSEGEIRGSLVDGDTLEHIYSAGEPVAVLAVNRMKRQK